MGVYETVSTEETRALGECLGRLVVPGTVILLKGELGAGKTTLVQGLALGLGIAGYLSSPSFTLVKEYMGRYPFYHLDLYRLEGLEQAEEIGLWDYLEGGAITAVEWAQRIPEIKQWLHNGYLEVELVPWGDRGERRRISLKARGSFCSSILEGLRTNC